MEARQTHCNFLVLLVFLCQERLHEKDNLLNLTTTGDVEVLETVGEVEIVDGMIELDYEPEETIFGFTEENRRAKQIQYFAQNQANSRIYH